MRIIYNVLPKELGEYKRYRVAKQIFTQDLENQFIKANVSFVYAPDKLGNYYHCAEELPYKIAYFQYNLIRYAIIFDSFFYARSLLCETLPVDIIYEHEVPLLGQYDLKAFDYPIYELVYRPANYSQSLYHLVSDKIFFSYPNKYIAIDRVLAQKWLKKHRYEYLRDERLNSFMIKRLFSIIKTKSEIYETC